MIYNKKKVLVCYIEKNTDRGLDNRFFFGILRKPRNLKLCLKIRQNDTFRGDRKWMRTGGSDGVDKGNEICG